MMLTNLIVLLKIEKGTDDGGNVTERVIEKREVFAGIKSIGQRENYKASAIGLKPELVFILADHYDYNDEEDIEFSGKRYSVIRTFRRQDSNGIELVVSRNAGVQNVGEGMAYG